MSLWLCGIQTWYCALILRRHALYRRFRVSTKQAISSLDCDKSLLDFVIYLVLTWLLPMGIKGYSLTRSLSKLQKFCNCLFYWVHVNMVRGTLLKRNRIMMHVDFNLSVILILYISKMSSSFLNVLQITFLFLLFCFVFFNADFPRV